LYEQETTDFPPAAYV